MHRFDTLRQFTAGDAGPAFAALRSAGCWTTVDHVPALWSLALSAAARTTAHRPDGEDRYHAGGARLHDTLARRTPGPSSARDDYRWKRAWQAWPGAVRTPERFLELVRSPLLDGARSAALRGPRVPSARSTASLVEDFVDDLTLIADPLLAAPGPAAGWRDLAATVLIHGPTPHGRLAQLLGPGLAEHMARRALHTDSVMAGSAAALWPAWSVHRRAVELGRLLRGSPDGLQAWMEVHAFLRGGAAGPGGHGATKAWDDSRWHLAGLVLQVPASALVPAVCAVGGLAAVSRRAARRYGQRRAEKARAKGLLDDARPLLEPVDASLVPVDPDALRTWMLLAILRGQTNKLRARAEGDARSSAEGGSWQRVMDHHPVHDSVLRKRCRLREGIEIEAIFAGWAPYVRALVRLPPTRDLRHRMQALLAPVWSPQVRFPSRGARAMQRHARAWLDEWDARGLSQGTVLHLASTPRVRAASLDTTPAAPVLLPNRKSS